MKWINKMHFYMAFGFCILLICAYVFAWIRGANSEAVLLSGLFLLLLNILLFVSLYVLTATLAKHHSITKKRDT